MDFAADPLHDRSKLRLLTIVDTYTRECLTVELGVRLNSSNVVDILGRIAKDRDYQNVFTAITGMRLDLTGLSII